jgi:hypothetical protein
MALLEGNSRSRPESKPRESFEEISMVKLL